MCLFRPLSPVGSTSVFDLRLEERRRGEREKGKRLDDLRVTTEETRASMEDERDDIKKSDMIYACRLYVYVRM